MATPSGSVTVVPSMFDIARPSVASRPSCGTFTSTVRPTGVSVNELSGGADRRCEAQMIATCETDGIALGVLSHSGCFAYRFWVFPRIAGDTKPLRPLTRGRQRQQRLGRSARRTSISAAKHAATLGVVTGIRRYAPDRRSAEHDARVLGYVFRGLRDPIVTTATHARIEKRRGILQLERELCGHAGGRHHIVDGKLERSETEERARGETLSAEMLNADLRVRRTPSAAFFVELAARA